MNVEGLLKEKFSEYLVGISGGELEFTLNCPEEKKEEIRKYKKKLELEKELKQKDEKEPIVQQPLYQKKDWGMGM